MVDAPFPGQLPTVLDSLVSDPTDEQIQEAFEKLGGNDDVTRYVRTIFARGKLAHASSPASPSQTTPQEIGRTIVHHLLRLLSHHYELPSNDVLQRIETIGISTLAACIASIGQAESSELTREDLGLCVEHGSLAFGLDAYVAACHTFEKGLKDALRNNLHIIYKLIIQSLDKSHDFSDDNLASAADRALLSVINTLTESLSLPSGTDDIIAKVRTRMLGDILDHLRALAPSLLLERR